MRNKTRVATTNSGKFPAIIRRNLKQVGQVLGGPNRVVRPGGADQIGQHMGNHAEQGDTNRGNPATPIYGSNALNPTKLGNQIAQETVCGVGGSRTIYKPGVQGTHGPVAPGNPTHKRNSFD